ncbi:hypothetical protein UlMin_006271 [Ulmus minor]
MLALSPSLFSTVGWPNLEDPTSHIITEDQNYLCRNYSTSESVFDVHLPSSTLPPSDQPPQVNPLLDRSSTPLTNTSIRSDLTNMVKKLNHNASERDRRKKINHLYSSLRELLPQTDKTKKLSIPATVTRILKYIPELQHQVEGMVRKKEELLSKITSKRQGNLVHQENQIKNTALSALSSVSACQLNDKEVSIQISTYKRENNTLSEILHNLEEDGVLLLNASSFESFGDQRVFHNLHLEPINFNLTNSERNKVSLT